MEERSAAVNREVDRACLHAGGHDPQLEELRAPWLYELARRLGRLDALRPRLVRSLSRRMPRAHAHTWMQRLELAAIDAAAGHADTRRAVLRFFATAVRTYAWYASWAVLRAAGGDGYAFGLRVMDRAGVLDASAFACWHSDAIEELGEGGADAIEQALAKELPSLRALRRASARSRGRQRRPRRPSRWSRADLEAILSGEKRASPYAIKRWARGASARRIAMLDQRIAETEDVDRLRSLFAAFEERPMTKGLVRALALARSPRTAVASRVLVALAATPDRRVWALARENVERGPATMLDGAIDILTRQRRSGDGALLAARLSRGIPGARVHSVGHSLLEWCERSRAPERRALLTWIWDHSPCSLCRTGSLRMLVRSGPLSRRIRREARQDASPRVRRLAGRRGGSR